MATATALASLVAGLPSASAGGGGAGPSKPARVTDARCVKLCAGTRKATVGSKVELRGHHLAGTVEVRFDGPGDSQLAVEPTKVGRHRAKARVPDGAVSGAPKAVDSMARVASAPKQLRIVAPEDIPEPGDFALKSAQVTPDKVFSYGERDAKLTYSFSGATSDVRIQVIRRSSGRVVKSWLQSAREPFAVNETKWDGTNERGVEAPNGRYKFKVGPAGGATDATRRSRFAHYDHVFPVRGHHSYGDGFGAPRDGHTHMGQDVFASCGTKLVAARGGEVQWKAYQSAAGYYLVIDGRDDRHDYMYAHMKGPATVRQGERVRTGETIGKVGQSGNATGCHLHFEYWQGDWWGGGEALPRVTRALKKWDSWS